MLQDLRFRGRTSLFKNQLTKGNASLQLKGVDFQDRGRYKCYTSTITGNEESFIDLHVEGMKLLVQKTQTDIMPLAFQLHIFTFIKAI